MKPKHSPVLACIAAAGTAAARTQASVDGPVDLFLHAGRRRAARLPRSA